MSAPWLVSCGAGAQSMLNSHSLAPQQLDGRPQVARAGLLRPASRLATRPEPPGVGMPLTRWLQLEWRADYRPSTWAIGYTGLRARVERSSLGARRAVVSADLEGGAGAGPGGATLCGSEDDLCLLGQRNRHWYRGVAYGAYVGAGGEVRVGPFALFARARLEIAEASDLPAIHRVTASLGGQLTVLGRVRIYATSGYLVDWDGHGANQGPAAEVGLWLPVDLSSFRRDG